jgi:ribosomal protein S8
MVRISVLNDALKNMFNAEKRGKRQVLIRPSSKVVIKFLSVMQKHGMSLCRNSQTLTAAVTVLLHNLVHGRSAPWGRVPSRIYCSLYGVVD